MSAPVKSRVARVKRRAIIKINRRPKRNDALFDGWSLVHLMSGILFGWVIDPAIALAILVLWEPLENIVLSPIFARFGIVFGYETIRNSLSDIFFDCVGVGIGLLLLSQLAPPFRLF